MKQFFFRIILVVFLSGVSHSQWTLEAHLPYDSLYNTPSYRACSVVDSTVSWVFGVYMSGPNLKMYIAKRGPSGWKEIRNNDLDTIFGEMDVCVAIDSSNAWVSDTYGKVARTSNGGYNWSVQLDISGNYVDAMKFSKKYPNIGYIVADAPSYTGVYLLKSTNFGNNWMQSFVPVSGFAGMYSSLSVVDSDCVWLGLSHIGTNNARVLKSTNGGINWQNYPIVDSDWGQLFMVFSSDKLQGFTDASALSPYTLMKTTNGGMNWSSGLSFGGFYAMNNMVWVNESSNIYFCSDGEIRKSTDNGNTWYTMTLPIVPGASDPIRYVDAVRINAGTIYGLAVTGAREVLKLVDTLRVIGIVSYGNQQPHDFSLHQNYPNPFNPTTEIKFAVPKLSHVTLKVFDLLGRVVAVLAESELKHAGEYSVQFDGTNLASGIYIYRLEADGFTNSKKMVLIK